MAHYGTLKDFRFSPDADDIRGSRLFGADDEKLGEIKDIIFEHSTGTIRYAVVDTGGWLRSRLFLIPADRIHPRPADASDFAVDMTKAQVERFPAYNESMVEGESEFRDYENRYKKELESGPVLHREGSTHTFTPEPEELPAISGSVDTGGLNVNPSRITDPFGDPAPSSDKLRMRPSGLASKAEDQRLPGSAAPAEKPTAAAERKLSREGMSSQASESKRETIKGQYDDLSTGDDPMARQQDRLTNPDDIYVPAADRDRRFAAFEDLLRRNHVDVTARCGSCAAARDEDKAA